LPSARIYLTVTPGARQSSLEHGADGSLRVRVAASAVEGRANRELLRFLAARLRVAPSRVRLVKGAAARYKTVEVDDLDHDEVNRRLRLIP